MTKIFWSSRSCFIHEQLCIIIKHPVSPTNLLLRFPFSWLGSFCLILLCRQMRISMACYFFHRLWKSGLHNSSLAFSGFFLRDLYFSNPDEEYFFWHININSFFTDIFKKKDSVISKLAEFLQNKSFLKNCINYNLSGVSGYTWTYRAVLAWK